MSQKVTDIAGNHLNFKHQSKICPAEGQNDPQNYPQSERVSPISLKLNMSPGYPQKPTMLGSFIKLPYIVGFRTLIESQNPKTTHSPALTGPRWPRVFEENSAEGRNTSPCWVLS